MSAFAARCALGCQERRYSFGVPDVPKRRAASAAVRRLIRGATGRGL